MGYLNSSFFKDLYRYFASNKLPGKKNVIHKVLTLSQHCARAQSGLCD